MTSTLITFLGRPPEKEGAYRKTRYDFGDGTVTKPIAFFGWTLGERLRPDRIVILGTAGSMWDHLVEGDLDHGGVAEDERLLLDDRVKQQQVGEADLVPFEPLLSERLACDVRLRLIPYCRDETEQIELLRILADQVDPGDRVDLDITHGFRHLPMLGLLSALHLRQVRNVEIAHIWYAAYDQAIDRAPVHDLAGLLNIADWIDGLSAYRRTGDYGVFSHFIGGETGRLLGEAGFLETVNRIGQARSRLREVLKRLDDELRDPVMGLFRDELRRRIRWAEGDNYYLRQRSLAYEYLDRGRYLDATLSGWEAFTTLLQREAGDKLDPDNHEHRQAVRDRFDSEERQKRPRDRWEAFDSLRRLRNAVAHGSQPKGDEVQRALGSADEMHTFLQALFDRLLPVGGA